MKVFKFFEMVRRAKLAKQFSVSIQGHTWPHCETCQKSVDAADLKNVNATSLEIWVKCHGKEDFCRIEFPFRIQGDPLEDDRANWAIKRAMADYCAFSRSHEE